MPHNAVSGPMVTQRNGLYNFAIHREKNVVDHIIPPAARIVIDEVSDPKQCELGFKGGDELESHGPRYSFGIPDVQRIPIANQPSRSLLHHPLGPPQAPSNITRPSPQLSFQDATIWKITSLEYLGRKRCWLSNHTPHLFRKERCIKILQVPKPESPFRFGFA